MNTSIRNVDPHRVDQSPGNAYLGKLTTSKGYDSSYFCMLGSFVAGLFFLLLSELPASAQGQPPGCTGSGLGILLFTDSADAHIGDTLTYSVTVFNGTGVGPVVCDASGIQALLITPDSASHPIKLVRTALSNGQSDYYTNVISYVVRAQDIQPDGTVRATAKDTGIINQNDTESQGGGNQGVNTQVSQPCIQISAQCTGSVGENGAIAINGTVKNCGNNTLVGVTVINLVNGGQFPVTVVATLQQGQSAPFNASYVPSSLCAPTTATLVAQGTDQFTIHPRTVTNSVSTACGNILTPGIVVTKGCAAAAVSPGQPLVYSGSVSNTGNVTLTNIVVVSDQPAPNTTVFTQPSLAPGAFATFSGSYPAPTNCSSASTLNVHATSVCGVAVTSSATSICPILTTPQIAVTVVCSATPVAPGAVLTYSGSVHNGGDIPLRNVIVVSDLPVPNTTVFTVATLAPGTSATFTGNYTVPAKTCAVTTTVVATGADNCTGKAVTDTASVTCPITGNARIAVTLACPSVPVATGNMITYTGTVSNPGNVTLNTVTVVVDQSSPSTVFTSPSLAPGASANFTATFATPADACTATGTVTASGTDVCASATVTDTKSAICSLATTPRISLLQNCPVSPVGPGSLLIYSGSVSNGGNITLTNLSVVNSQSGATPVFTAANLAPGASAQFTGSYTVPAASACSVTSTLTVTANDKCTGTRVTATTTTTCPLATAPKIEVTLSCPIVSVMPGSILVYSGSVSNAGNVTLNGVTVVNDRTGSTAVFIAASLAPGAVGHFTGSFVTHLDCCIDSSTVTASGNDSCTGIAATDTATRTCTLLTVPRIVVTKICNTKIVEPGDLMSYSGSVSNAGNIALIDVTVGNNNNPNQPTFLGPITLAAGESVQYFASFTIPTDFCGTDTVTARGLDSCTQVPVTNSVTSPCPVLITPRVLVTLNCPAQATPYGGVFEFTGTVTNPGNVTLINVFVVNDQPTNNTPIIGPITLAPGASTSFTGSHAAPTDCCQIIDTLTVSGQDRCSATRVTSTSSQVCPVLTTPKIKVTRVCPSSPTPAGSLFEYSGVVMNTGDVVLTNVMVFSNQPSTNTVVLGPMELAPGESEEFSGSYLLTAGSNPAADIVTASGSDIYQARTVTAKANCSGPILDITPPVLGPLSVTSGVVNVSWTATPGVSYSVQSQSGLKGATWQTHSPNVIATGTNAFMGDSATDVQRIYRVMVVE